MNRLDYWKSRGFLTLYPTRGLSSEPSMDVGALGRPPGAPTQNRDVSAEPATVYRLCTLMNGLIF